jgi:hypothetical protein
VRQYETTIDAIDALTRVDLQVMNGFDSWAVYNGGDHLLQFSRTAAPVDISRPPQTPPLIFSDQERVELTKFLTNMFERRRQELLTRLEQLKP